MKPKNRYDKFDELISNYFYYILTSVFSFTFIFILLIINSKFNLFTLIFVALLSLISFAIVLDKFMKNKILLYSSLFILILSLLCLGMEFFQFQYLKYLNYISIFTLGILLAFFIAKLSGKIVK